MGGHNLILAWGHNSPNTGPALDDELQGQQPRSYTAGKPHHRKKKQQIFQPTEKLRPGSTTTKTTEPLSARSTIVAYLYPP